MINTQLSIISSTTDIAQQDSQSIVTGNDSLAGYEVVVIRPNIKVDLDNTNESVLFTEEADVIQENEE